MNRTNEYKQTIRVTTEGNNAHVYIDWAKDGVPDASPSFRYCNSQTQLIAAAINAAPQGHEIWEVAFVTGAHNVLIPDGADDAPAIRKFLAVTFGGCHE